MDLWEVMSEFRAHCCACFPTFTLPVLSKPQASCGAHLYLCYLLHSLPWQGSDLPELAFPAVLGEWTLHSPAGAWYRMGALSGWDLLLWSFGWSGLPAGAYETTASVIAHLYKRLKNCFQIKQLVTYCYFKKYWRPNIMRRGNVLK